ncbi:hypothetical protein K2173_011218 [Erythroxylum novogranatense]|uniref:Uncharacterized protein n=1 Tax=Erythroxylum novogranatense TaxID=1862640 RepID=A0AAV8TVC2_9ROSI|nr:hypothetical protein K2173_011218 [Erythroxylum novogranatense]
MRLLFCKIHFPLFICFCKTSTGIYTSRPLKLENTPLASSTTAVSVPDVTSKNTPLASSTTAVSVPDVTSNNHASVELADTTEEILDADENKIKTGNLLKSCLKKQVLDSKKAEKKRVQWRDFLGEELVEIREFQPSESEDLDGDDQGSRRCFCIIL